MSPMCFRFFRVPLVRNGVAALSLASLLVCPSGAVSPVEPAWWAQYEAVDPYGQSDDFAAANVGQLKYIASRAAAALNDAEAATQAPLTAFQLQAKTAIDAMLATWDEPPLPDVIRDDFQALNAGQLKQVASLFYDRLGLPHPWPAVSTDDHQMVNVGQLKHVFAFDPRFRGAVVAATIPASLLQAAFDAWEALPTKPAGSSPDDFDGDGIPNLQQYLSGRPLLDPADLDGDRIPDSVETASGGILDPLRFADAVADHDGDGVMNYEEVLLALTLGSATTPARTDTLEDAAVLVWSLPLGRPLIPRVDPLRTFWEGIDAAWLDEQVGPGYESWLEDQDLNTNGLPDGLEAFRTAALVDFTWSPYPDIGTIQYPPLAYDPAGGTIDADQDGNPDFDRDADTLPDLWEYRYQLDPRDPGDATLDPDQDGLNNLAEYLAGTHPRLADSDGDGFTDGEEWNASSPASNPLAAASVPPLVLAIGSGSGQQIPVGSTSAAPLIAHVTQGARPRQGAEVTFSVTSGSSSIYSASLAQASTSLTLTTDTQGNAAVNLLAGSITGPAVVTATLTSGGQPVTFALIITAAPPAYGIGSPASPYGTSSGAPQGTQAIQSNPFDNWDSIYVIWGNKSLYAHFQEYEREDEKDSSSAFSGYIANWSVDWPFLRTFPVAESDKTSEAVAAFEQQRPAYRAQPYNHILGLANNAIIEPYYAIDDVTSPYSPDGEQRHKWTSWDVTSLRFGSYSPHLALSFLVLVEMDTKSAYPPPYGQPSDEHQIIASGSLHFKDRTVSWSENLNDFLTPGSSGEVILDPGKKASTYLASTKTGNIKIRLFPVEIELRGSPGEKFTSAPENSARDAIVQAIGPDYNNQPIDTLGELPLGLGRNDPPLTYIEYCAPCEATCIVPDIPGMTWKWKRSLHHRYWRIHLGRQQTPQGPGPHEWQVSLTLDRSQNDDDPDDAHADVIRSPGTGRIYTGDSSGVNLKSQALNLVVGDYYYEERQFIYGLECTFGGQTFTASSLEVGQIMRLYRKGDTAPQIGLALDFEAKGNTIKARHLDLKITEDEVRAFVPVSEGVPVNIPANANP